MSSGRGMSRSGFWGGNTAGLRFFIINRALMVSA